MYMYHFECISLCSDVTVSVPAMLSVGEGDEMVQVCATLFVTEDTERDVTIKLATIDGIGINKVCV